MPEESKEEYQKAEFLTRPKREDEGITRLLPAQGGAVSVDLIDMVRGEYCLYVNVDTSIAVGQVGESGKREKLGFVVFGMGSSGQEEFQLADNIREEIVDIKDEPKLGFCSLSPKDNLQFGREAPEYDAADRRLTRFFSQHELLKKVGAAVAFKVDEAYKLTVTTKGRLAAVTLMPVKTVDLMGVTSIPPNLLVKI